MLASKITGKPEFTQVEGHMPDTHNERLTLCDLSCCGRLAPEVLRWRQALIQVAWPEYSECCADVVC